MTKSNSSIHTDDNLSKAIKAYGTVKFIKESGIGRAMVYAVISGKRRFGEDNAKIAMSIVNVCQCCQQRVKTLKN